MRRQDETDGPCPGSRSMEMSRNFMKMGDGDDFKGLCTVHRSPVGAVRLCLKDLAGIDPSGLSIPAGSFLRGRTIFHTNGSGG